MPKLARPPKHLRPKGSDLSALAPPVVEALAAFQQLAPAGTLLGEHFETLETFCCVAMRVMARTDPKVIKAEAVEAALAVELRQLDAQQGLQLRPTSAEATLL